MKKITEELLEKYFNDRCTEAEAEEVLQWFSTEEGIKYLNDRLDEDFTEVGKEASRIIEGTPPDIQSSRMWSRIKRQSKLEPVHKKSKVSHLNLFLKVAAMVAILTSVSLFYFRPESSSLKHTDKMISYQTGRNQQEALTLADGTRIRLNSNSRVMISQKILNGRRKVILHGEAYFEVMHDSEDHPLTIYAGKALIKDLGTKFDVKEDNFDNKIQVAVIEGAVSLRLQDTLNSAVNLTKGQFAIMDLGNGEVKLDQKDISNYLNWVNGRIVFNTTSLSEISAQLHRIYRVKCTFMNTNLRQLKLTADFKSHSLKQVLDVISKSLNIHYKLEGNNVTWMNR